MSKEKGKEKVSSKQFRWLPPMHTAMLTLLAEEAMKGNKPLNTFKSGFGWDDNLKMITCDAKTYQEEVMQENGDDTEIVVDNGEEGVVDKGEKGKNVLKEIAVALKEINQGLVDYTSLYSEVMAMTLDGYSEDMLATAFDH
nr:hypothetical protein CFP56_36530 [Quercus suber]